MTKGDLSVQPQPPRRRPTATELLPRPFYNYLSLLSSFFGWFFWLLPDPLYILTYVRAGGGHRHYVFCNRNGHFSMSPQQLGLSNTFSGNPVTEKEDLRPLSFFPGVWGQGPQSISRVDNFINTPFGILQLDIHIPRTYVDALHCKN